MSESGWAQGYVTDTHYADKFFRELSPAWLNYVAALNGALPRDLDQPFTYLELGCGFGSSTVVNAGAFPHGEFHACDFNPAHIDGGRRHAAALGIGNVQFHEGSFAHLLARDLPPFDYIVLHGVYSWVGAEARQAIRRVIRERLKPAGLVYLSYNCLPGWSVEAPLRKLLLELAAVGDGGSPRRTDQAVRSLTELSRGRLRYFNANPSAATAVDAYAKGTSHYLAHEFLNQSWELFYSVDIADEMAELEMRYLGSATLADNHPALIVDALAAEAVATLPTARLRRLAIDFATNQRFRRDVFVRSQEALGPADITRHLHAVPIGTISHPGRISTTAKVPRGEIRFQEDFIRTLQQLLLRGSMTIGDAITALGGGERPSREPPPRGPSSGPIEIARNIIFLVAAGVLMPFAKTQSWNQQESGIGGRGSGIGDQGTGITRREGKARRPGNPMVARALADVIERRAVRAIPSEVLGNGVELHPVEALVIRAWLADADVETISTRVATEIQRLNLAIRRDGKAVQSGDELVKYAGAAAAGVIEDLVPSLARLGLIV